LTNPNNRIIRDIERKDMTIKELEKEIREKITVLDKDELKKIIKYIDELCNDDVVEYNDTINHLKK
jgi:ribosome-binding protein aMBF1 (putative translation factor)